MKVLVAMSGGVDSSAAALILKEAGYTCFGATMRLTDNEDTGKCNFHTCCSRKDIEDASEVCYELDIPYEVIDYRGNFREKIIDKFVKTYMNGGTPNPCIDCNRFMKFEGLLEYATSKGIDKIATGHYARIVKDEASGRYLLKKAFDRSKDQSYVLYMLTQEQLARIEFPLGEMTKAQVRAKAAEHGFVNAHKHDSQDICFVPDRDYARFVEEHSDTSSPHGDFVDSNGNVLGEHKGIIHYTIGQRKGLGISSDSPLFVTKIDPEINQVVLSHGDGLYKKRIILKDINLISVPSIEGALHAAVKIRYRHEEQPAAVTQIDDDTLEIIFDEGQRAPTVGQAAVIYDGDTVVGGGTISQVVG